MIKNNRIVGENIQTRYCGEATVIAISGHETTVQFPSGYIVTTDSSNVRKGVVKDPYYKSFFGVGYLGEGRHKISVNKKVNPIYYRWVSMLKRCYVGLAHTSCYWDVAVCEEWHCFQNYADWFAEHSVGGLTDDWEVDKDLLSEESRVYSPETCVLLPREINAALISAMSNSATISGATYLENKKKWIIGYTKPDGKRSTKLFKSWEDAQLFRKTCKEDRIKALAGEYKELLQTRAYEALMVWEFKIVNKQPANMENR